MRTHQSCPEVDAPHLPEVVIAEVEAGEGHVVLHGHADLLSIAVRQLVTCRNNMTLVSTKHAVNIYNQP